MGLSVFIRPIVQLELNEIVQVLGQKYETKIRFIILKMTELAQNAMLFALEL